MRDLPMELLAWLGLVAVIFIIFFIGVATGISSYQDDVVNGAPVRVNNSVYHCQEFSP